MSKKERRLLSIYLSAILLCGRAGRRRVVLLCLYGLDRRARNHGNKMSSNDWVKQRFLGADYGGESYAWIGFEESVLASYGPAVYGKMMPLSPEEFKNVWQGDWGPVTHPTLPTVVFNRHDLNARRELLTQGYEIVYCGRGSPWGNMYAKRNESDRPYVIAAHRKDVLASPTMIADVKQFLTGRALECFCKPKSCHCDVYAEICNERR